MREVVSKEDSIETEQRDQDSRAERARGDQLEVRQAGTVQDRRPSLRYPALIVFVSNACIMILELVAGRLLAPNIGVSLYTWTSIIGVIFAGMSAGNYIGGALADRHASRRTLGGLFVLAGVGAWLVVAIASLLSGQTVFALNGAPLLLRTLLFVALVFLVPSVLLGMISPFVIKLAVRDLARTGGTVGRIYAASALGSILGTFLTGYVLVFYIGVQQILLIVGAGLCLLGLVLAIRGAARRTVADYDAPVDASAAPRPLEDASERLRFPSLIVFVSNTCLMVVQLVASRLVAPVIGVSLYTWTSLIGVMLAGISLGNYLGGRLADAVASRKMLALALLVNALAHATLLVIFAWSGVRNTLAGVVSIPFEFQIGLPEIEGLSLVPRMVLFYGALFFLPSVMLGLISPLVIKLTLRDLVTTGRAMGRISGASTIGNILGTFATGYVLISTFGTRMVLLGVVMVLLAFGLWLMFADRLRWIGRAASFASIVALIATPSRPVISAALAGNCLRETDYFCIRVRDDTEDGKRYRRLTLDRLVHSYVVLGDPTDLRYQYEQVGAEVADYLAARDGRVDAFFIGGGGYSLPRYLEAVHPGGLNDVAEIDPGVTEVAYEQLELKRGGAVRSINDDARLYLATAPAEAKYSFVLGDAFNDFSVPYHLTTREFNQLVRAHMRDDGVYMLNLIDGNTLPFVGAFLRTLRLDFEHVYLITSGGQLTGAKRNTFVLLASPQPIDLDRLRTFASADKVRNVDAWLVAQAEVDALMATESLILTDNFVPTDRLLAPMFEASEAVK
jgi:spermidine synthase/MFS family permease